jgi:hypothetical protein
MRELRRFAVGLLVGAALVAAAGRLRAEDEEKGLTLDGPVVVFVLPEIVPGMDDPAGDFRTMPRDVGKELKSRGIKMITTTPALIQHKSRDRKRQVDFRTTPSFVGTIFFKPQTEPEINRGAEKQGELMMRVDEYFGKKKKKG